MWLPLEAHPDTEPDTKFLCFNIRAMAKQKTFSQRLKTLNRAKPHLYVRDWVEFGFKSLVDRTIREQRSEERRLAEQRTRKHQFKAIKSCIPDARSYRMARRGLLLLARAQF